MPGSSVYRSGFNLIFLVLCLLVQSAFGAPHQVAHGLDLGAQSQVPDVPDSKLLRHWVVYSEMIESNLRSEANTDDLTTSESDFFGFAFARFFFFSAASKGDCEIESEQAIECCDERKAESTWQSWTTGFRFGEALHPGPWVQNDEEGTDLLNIGLCNTTKIRRKEPQIIEMGPGIWNFAETHWTEATACSSSFVLKKLARTMNRNIKFVTGAPVGLRSNSSWAGSWSGVAQMTDLPAVPLSLNWPADHWSSSRIMATRQWASNLPLTIGTFYGYPLGPTWPKARSLSNQLLENFTREIIYGTAGVRIIAGDFNADPGALTHQKLWQQQGWVNAQTYAAEHLSHQWQPTCKNSTERDQIWLSPEAASLLRSIEIHQLFADHSTIVVKLQVPLQHCRVLRWPLPGEIPWEKLQDKKLLVENRQAINGDLQENATFEEWSASFEVQALQCLQHQDIPTNPNMMGRGRRTKPIEVEETMPIPKSSRNGEIVLQNDLIGNGVKLHFRQARRLQSLLHAARAGKQTPQATEYRVSLWTAILKARGFQHSFGDWWQKLEKTFPESPAILPSSVPDMEIVELLYQEFMIHFRRLERFHVSERTRLLKEKYQVSLKQLFRELRPQTKNTPDVFVDEKQFEVIDIDHDQGLLRLEPCPEHHDDDLWLCEGFSVQIVGFDGAICKVQTEAPVELGDFLVQKSFSRTISQVHQKLVNFWQPRWQRMADLPDEVWSRVLAFAQSYFPRFELELHRLSQQEWRDAVVHMKKGAARGLDGFSRSDLHWMSDQHLHWLLQMLDKVESGDQEWPEQLLHATVICLEKFTGACQAGSFRPISIFSVIYRVWSGLRTRQMLTLLRQVLPSGIHGFVPGAETAEIWLQTQGQIELAHQEQASLIGLSADLQKAFNHIGRRQTRILAEKVGVSNRIIVPWNKFISKVQRRFDVRGCLSEPLVSTSGYPEGCPMSILGMILANWAHHQYQAVFSPNVNTYSFVDNLTLTSRSCEELVHGFVTTSTFYKMWGLEIDDSKTFVWATTSEARQQLKALNYPVAHTKLELGGVMTFTRKNRISPLRQRDMPIEDKWKKLTRSQAPTEQKLKVIPIAIWAALLHGTEACKLTESFFEAERRKAAKALRWQAPGTNLRLKFAFSSTPTADPEYYRLCRAIGTFCRMLKKQDGFMIDWIQYFEGDQSCAPGPFHNIRQVLNSINWEVARPPNVLDHDGHMINFLHYDETLLKSRLREAWANKVCGEVKHATMAGLHGVELPLTFLA